MFDDYLGDGVYASFDGYHIVLDLRAQDASRIALEPSVMARLKEYEASLPSRINSAREAGPIETD